jgi:hypothetical protein
MIALAPTLIALLAVAGALIIAIRTRRSAASLIRATMPMDTAAVTGTIVRAVRRRMLVAVVIALLVALALSRLAFGDVAAGMALAPGVGGALGLLVLATSPFPRRAAEGGLRSADLTPRAQRTFGPRWGFAPPLVTMAILVVLVVVTGVNGSDVDGPFSNDIQVTVPGHGTSSAGPYPDWSYGVLILGGTILLVAAMLLALHRVATAPQIGRREIAGLDAALRATMTRFIALSTTAVVVLYLGAVSLTAGSAARTASYWDYVRPSYQARQLALCGHKATCSWLTPAADTISGVAQPTYALGFIGAVLGIVLIAVAIALALLALTSLTMRGSVEAQVRPEMVDA